MHSKGSHMQGADNTRTDNTHKAGTGGTQACFGLTCIGEAVSVFINLFYTGFCHSIHLAKLADCAGGCKTHD